MSDWTVHQDVQGGNQTLTGHVIHRSSHLELATIKVYNFSEWHGMMLCNTRCDTNLHTASTISCNTALIRAGGKVANTFFLRKHWIVSIAVNLNIPVRLWERNNTRYGDTMSVAWTASIYTINYAQLWHSGRQVHSIENNTHMKYYYEVYSAAHAVDATPYYPVNKYDNVRSQKLR